MKYLEFIAYINSLPQWIQIALTYYARTQKSYGPICVDVDYISKLKGVEKKLATFNLKARFIRINPHIDKDDRGGADYTHYILHLEVVE